MSSALYEMPPQDRKHTAKKKRKQAISKVGPLVAFLSLRLDMTNYFHLLLLDKRGGEERKSVSVRQKTLAPRSLRAFTGKTPYANLLITAAQYRGT